MYLEKVDQFVQQLEQRELEAENGVASAELYTELYAGYFYQNDLSNARYLWKRIPQNIKTGSIQLEKLHCVFLTLWNNNTQEFFKAINYEWSKDIAELMFELKEKIKNETIELIGKAYSSIFESVFLDMTNIHPNMVTETCNMLGWCVEKDENNSGILIPKKKFMANSPITSSEDQLFVLTDFVSFLEN